jgi:hypothetical protein
MRRLKCFKFTNDELKNSNMTFEEQPDLAAAWTWIFEQGLIGKSEYNRRLEEILGIVKNPYVARIKAAKQYAESRHDYLEWIRQSI